MLKQRASILVVDDETMLREAVQRLLQHDGYEVVAVDSGEAALARLAERQFDLVMTDFSMPGMAGDELVMRIREKLPAQRIIMATAFVEEYRVFGQPTGSIDALLLKPFSFQELHDAVAMVLAQPGPQPPDFIPPIIERPPTDDFPPPPGP